MKIIDIINKPPIKVFNEGLSLIKYHTHIGPIAVSNKKNIPISGELMYWGARLIKTNETPTVSIIKKIKNKSDAPNTNEDTKNRDTNAVISLPKIYDGTKFMWELFLITVKLAATKLAQTMP